VSNGVVPPSPVPPSRTPSQAMAGFGPGTRLRGYRLEEQIGRGGMAVVFRALDERLNRLVALKLMVPAQTLDDAFRQRFVRESQAAAAVDDPHIIPVYEAGEADGVLFIAMRLVRGGDLKTLVARHGPLEPARVEWILSGVASALDAAHASGLVHRDVKPANMLLDVRPGRPDHVYLSDFGVTKGALETADLTGSGQFLGTVDYASPEQVKGRAVDGRTDQYALGCSAYELLCGRPPFAGREPVAAMYAHVSEPPPKASAVCQGLPAAVDAVFARVLAKDPDQRYDTCLDFTRALRAAFGLSPYVDDEPVKLANGGAAIAFGDDDTLDPAAVRRQVILAGQAASAGLQGVGATTELPAMDRGGGQATASPGNLGIGRQARRRLLVAVLAVAVLVAGASVALALGRGSPAGAAPTAYFPPSTYSSNLAVTQAWMLTGPQGSALDVTITVRNTSASPASVQLEEPIPGAVAVYPRAIRFGRGSRPRTELAGIGLIVAVWDFSLPAGGNKVVSFTVPEPPAGATQARLETLVSAYTAVENLQDLQRLKAGRRPGLQRMVIMPSTVELEVGQTDTLTLLVPNLKADSALRRALSKAVWHSDHPAAVTVSSHGMVTGVALGNARVTARVGSLTASAIVKVLPLGTSPSVGQQPQPVYSSPGGQTAPITTPPVVQSSPMTTPATPGLSTSTSGSASVGPSQTSSSSPTSGTTVSPSNSATG
jgi:hypothetical protein